MRDFWKKFLAGFAVTMALAGGVMAGGSGPTVVEPFIWTNDGTAASPSHAFIGAATGIYRAVSGRIGFSVTGTAALAVGTGGAAIRSDGAFAWSASTNPEGSVDVVLARDAANTLAQRNGTNGQGFRVYNTYTDASNYERATLGWSASDLYLVTEGAGTGTARNMVVGTNGAAGLTFRTNSTGRWNFNSAGHFVANADNAYDIGASGANRPRIGYFGTGVFSPYLQFNNEGRLSSFGDGIMLMRNNALADFNRLQFGGTTSSFPAIKRDSAGLQIRLADDSANADLDTRTVETDGFTVGTLPTCNAGAAGTRAYVTDAAAPTYLGALVGGGAVVAPVFCNGTAWVSG